MKKFLIFTLGLLFSTNLFSQISVDKVEEDGSRYIMSSYYNLYKGWDYAAGFRLSYVESPDDDSYYRITVSLNEGKMQFDLGRKLLLKFKDNSILELKNVDEIGPADYEYDVTSSGTNYYTYPKYLITEEEIEKIINGEVIKIRIENNIEFFDREIKKNKFSKNLKIMYEAIKAKRETQNDVYQNF